ncbi:MAG: hypothetical protein V1792_19735 [Pseudomonadota bacterium]
MLHFISSVTHLRLVAMLGACEKNIRASRAERGTGLRRTTPKLSLQDDRQDAGPTEESLPVIFVGRASLPVIFRKVLRCRL